MRKIVLMISVSLDGFVAGPNGELDWQSIDEELHQEFNDRLRPMSAFLNGRVVYQQMAEYWPTADRDPTSTPVEVEYAGIWREMPKIVYSKTLEQADWNATIVRDVVVDEVQELKAQPGGDMALGGANLAATFMRLDLIDEYTLYVHPVILGRGQPLFRNGEGVKLRIVETRAFGNGVVLVRYQR